MADSDVKYTEINPDWERINKTLLHENMNNQTLIQEAYEEGIKLIYLKANSNPVPFPNVYYTIVSHKLVEVHVDSQWANFNYDIEILNRWTNKTSVLKVTTNALKSENNFWELSGSAELLKGIQPIASLAQLRDVSKINVNYNALEILYNRTLRSILYRRAEQEIRSETLKELKRNIQGSFAHSDPSFFANITDEGIEFEFYTVIVPGAAHANDFNAPVKTIRATLLLDSNTNQISLRDVVISKTWYFRNLFVQPKNPQVDDTIISFPQRKN